MKILFASDISFNYFSRFPAKKQVCETMRETAEYFHASDFSILNLENIVGEKTQYTPIVKTGPNLISEDRFLAYIDMLCPTAVGLANNHAGDFGEGALHHTIQLLQQKYRCIGAGKNIEEAYRPAEFTKDGIKVSVFAVCENEFGIATENAAGAAGYRLELVTEAIRLAKSNGSMPVIYFHGGNEHNPFPSPGKVALYRHFIDLGAVAVIAMHTHCPQGYEFYQGKPIVYSMGNFFFPHANPATTTWHYGYMTELEISENKIGLNVIPYHFDFAYHSVLCGKEKDRFIAYLEILNNVIQDKKLLQRYFDAWCMIAGMDYIKTLKYSETMEQDGAEAIKEVKNLLSCEAHNELMANTLKILFEARCDSARTLVQQIKKLQGMKN